MTSRKKARQKDAGQAQNKKLMPQWSYYDINYSY